MNNIHDIKITTISGETQTLEQFKGKTLLVVNVASECGLTPQYEALEALYAANKSKGLEILGFPCNQFGGQEPGSEEQISEFCSLNYGVSFPMFKKIEVNGDQRHPLYAHLLQSIPERTASPGSNFVEKLKNFGIEVKDGDILWNFEKFLINAEGQVVGHFAPDMTPDDAILQAAIKESLSA